MAGPLAAVERFFERLFERPAARLFQARVEPVHIQRSLERAMEAERAVHARRAYAPSTYRVLLSPPDLAALDGDRSALRNELSEALRVFARAHGYTLLARPHVAIEQSNVVAAGDIRVFADQPVIPAGAPPFSIGADDASNAPDVEAQEIPLGEATAVFAAPQPSVPRAVLVIRTPGQAPNRIYVRAGTVRLGRSRDNEIVLADDRVSRRHGQIGLRLGMLVYTDLGSTNGSFLNGSPVTEIALGPGDVLQLGSSTITIEPGN
jgi:FHA domain-containing protein